MGALGRTRDTHYSGEGGNTGSIGSLLSMWIAMGYTGKVVYCLSRESAGNVRGHDGARDEL
jgi:hypothetical protein